MGTLVRKPELGLALSGGGFRAAFFHIGVLGFLADANLLRHVEVLSTVSGGSIIGALYYLRLKQRILESRTTASRDDLIDVVKDVRTAFRRLVRRNPRVRAFLNPVASLKSAVTPRYTRSDRLGEMLDRELYRPAAEQSSVVTMNDLLVRKIGKTHPNEANGDPARDVRIPMLFLNATSLNTGRHWVFTPTWTGERFDEEMSDDERADVNAILEGFYYKDANEHRYQQFPLGIAVASSACVPGLFPPLPLTGLFNGWTPQLVDGGVHDNQGYALLDEYRCTWRIVSDATGLLPDETSPLPFPTSVLPRANALLMDRVRDIALGEALRDRGAVRIAHIRSGIPIPKIKTGHSVAPGPPEAEHLAQHLLSRIRTDLDAFHDIEADMLTALGYEVCRTQMSVPFEGLPIEALARSNYGFEWAFDELHRPSKRTLGLLHESSHRLFKVPSVFISRWLWQVFALLVLAVVLRTFWFSGPYELDLEVRPGLIVAAIAAAVAFLLRFDRLRLRIEIAIFGVIAATLGATLAALHLAFLNPLYLWAGRVKTGAQK